MFTGLVEELGRVVEVEPQGNGGVRLVLEHSEALGQRLTLGASLAVSGTCLTLIAQEPGKSVVEMSPETLERTTLASVAVGTRVNLEPALRMGDPLGGHWVQGHVDGVTEVVSREDTEEFRTLGFKVPVGFEPSFVEKGSVTVDGVSLTVSALSEESFEVALIPHTLAETTLGERNPGDQVNFEVDVLAKYVQKAIAASLASLKSSSPSG